MPIFGNHKHSNRSKQTLNDSSSGQGSASVQLPSASSSSSNFALSGTADEARAAQTFSQQPQPYVATPNSEFEQRTYQDSGSFPSRSQSTRFPPGSYPPPLAQAVNSVDDLILDARAQKQQQQQSGQAAPLEQKKSRGFFGRIKGEPKPSPPSPSPQTNTGGLGRRVSKRGDNLSLIRTSQRTSSEQQQRLDWPQDSKSHLRSPLEIKEDEGGLDPYLIRDSENPAGGSFAQESNQSHTIRPVESEAPRIFTPTDNPEQYYRLHQNPSPVHYQQQEGFPQNSQQHSNGPRRGSLPLDNQFGLPSAETASQLSYDSPIEQREDSGGQSNGPSPTSGYSSQQQEYPPRTTSSVQGPRPLSQSAMPPPTGASQPRRTAEQKQTLGREPSTQGQGDLPPGYNQHISRNQPTIPGASPLPPPVGQAAGPGFRGGPAQRELFGAAAAAGGGEQGRSTPPPTALGERDINDAYKELSQKYKKVKGLYFDKTSQVEQLQNTLANQRLSQSRTSLDDSEYMTRFQRLDGATTNLAFNIRKDWRSVPSWIAQHVNQDALKIGKQEMTGVGRACITRFLVDEMFQKTFHPGLETELSTSLKNIEQNIRRFSPALNNQEESDALTAKVVQWRLATLDGLRDVLSSPESEEHRKQFSRVATTNLTASLVNFLAEPAPAGIEDSAHMIVELAVSIACNLPLESRDISIVLPMPGDIVQPFIMKTEAGIPALENPGAETNAEVESSSAGNAEKDEAKEGEKEKARKDKKGTAGMLQAMMSGSTSGTKKTPMTSESEGKKPEGDGTQKVRFAGFVGVEVRGRQILSKAPVWTVGG